MAAAVTAVPASAEELSLNYERLSLIEEPIAMAVGGVTLLLHGVLDLPEVGSGDDRDTDEAGLIGNVEVTALAQLPNRWRVELGYFGQRATDAGLVPGSPDRTIDHGVLARGLRIVRRFAAFAHAPTLPVPTAADVLPGKFSQ